MRTFSEIRAIAAERKGGEATLDALIGPAEATGDLAERPDSFYLAEMTRRVFQSGFSWTVIDAKWQGFHEAFRGFDVHACAFMAPDWLDALCKDRRIVRHAAKIGSVPDNARFILDVAGEHGSFGRMLADWPAGDHVGLLNLLNKRGARLGGMTGQYFLRFVGRDGFILSRDVVGRLIAEGVVARPPSSQKDMKAVQTAFSAWAAESGCSLREISRTLALSTD
ncbi:MAG: DNA-3-methyladenine glycosylase I [Alphaproteobacteria bacterium]|nr:DNA-3-methyladenine glycosylase I [Alphaproteobacteria bacterium]